MGSDDYLAGESAGRVQISQDRERWEGPVGEWFQQNVHCTSRMHRESGEEGLLEIDRK